MENKNKQFPYRIGLDLGTSSIGVAIYSLDKDGNINKLEHLDSYIFGEPVKPKEMQTLNTDRRSARLIRRQVERKAARYKKISYIAQTLGVTQRDLYEIRNQDVHKLRAQAVSERLTMPQFIKVLCHLLKNRGYKGSIKESTVGKKLKTTADMLKDGKTLGQILYERKQAAAGSPWRKIEDDGTFIYRKDVEREFELIWQQQAKHLPQLNGNYQVGYPNMFPDYPNVKELPLKEAFRSALFYQRPIKWPVELVGNCEVYPEEKRAATSQSAYQNYRIAKEIANLRIYNFAQHREYPLTYEQKTFSYDYISRSFQDYTKDNCIIPFGKIYEKLSLSKEEVFKQDRGSKQGIKGNTTLYAFYKTKTLGDWESLGEKPQELVLEFLNNITTFSDIEDNDNSYIKAKFAEQTKNIFHRTEDDILSALNFIFKLKENKIFSDKNFSLENNRSSYGITALNTLTEEILKGREEYDIIAEIKPLEDVSKEKMRNPKQIKNQQAINDPVMLKALNEFHRVMQYILLRYGKPDEMVIELSREIKNSLKRRYFLESQNALASKERQKAIQELLKNNIYVSPRNIEKYLLWEEQNYICPYSGETISIGQAFDENITQVDHIIPQNWQGGKGGPNVFSNKVLVFKKENQDKSNKLPYEWKFKNDIDSYLQWLKEYRANKKSGKADKQDAYGNHSSLINFVQHLKGLYEKEKKGFYSEAKRKWTPTQKGNRIKDKIDNLLIMPQEVNEEFSNRQNQETAWIGKIVMDWCKDFCPKVTPSYGALTAYLREQLQFDRILPSVRIAEGKPLFDKDDNEIDSQKWQELFDKNLTFDNICALKQEFESYLKQLPQQANTDTDKEKALKDFCAGQRALNEFYKRCDHRHHAVDAAIIGLCNLSMVQKASAHNGKYGTLHKIKFYDKEGTYLRENDTPGFQVDNIPMYAKIKDIVKQYLTDYVVWHKPDHYPSGKLFDETAYNVQKKNGKERFIKRADLSSFIKSTPEQTIKNIELLVYGDTLKEEIIRQFKERLVKGISQEEALCGKKDFPSDGIIYHGNKIKKVKYMYLVGRGIRKFDDNADIKLFRTDKTGKEHIKGYQNGAYACMDFDGKTGKIINLIPLWKYHKNKETPESVIRIFINDVLFDKTDKKFYKVQQFSGRDGIKLCLTTEITNKFISTKNIKDYILVKSRQDIAKIKKEYGK